MNLMPVVNIFMCTLKKIVEVEIADTSKAWHKGRTLPDI